MRRFTDERGMALPMVIVMIGFLSIAVGTVIVYSTSSQREADTQKKTQYAHAAAEGALATAVSVLATAADPRVASALPGCAQSPLPTVTAPKAVGTYCGDLDLTRTDWTITARGYPGADPVATGQVTPRVLTQVASIVPPSSAGLGELWNRLYQYDTNKCAEFKKIVITVPVVTRGCVKLDGDDHQPTELAGDYVTIGGDVELKHVSSIGLPGDPISRADIGGTCTLEHGSGPHSPCSSLDAVYATTIATTAADLARPTVDFPYWYANSKPGPLYPCTVGSLPVGSEFDHDQSYDRDGHEMNLTPKDTSYSCKFYAGNPSVLIGELSWDALEQVLTIKGTIFFDGDVKAKDAGHSKACHGHNPGPYCDTVINYQGQGTIYASGKVEIEEGICAGGDGSNDCEDDPANWDPTQNTLIFISGGLRNIGDETFKMDKDQAIFQGAVWTQGKCKVGKKASISAPLICGQLNVKEDDSIDDPTVNPWPASLIGTRPGQVYPTPTGAFNIILQPEVEQ